MVKYSFRMLFTKSRSKNYQQAIKLAAEFENFSEGELNIVDVLMKEIFEKWGYFNLLFWITVDWKGMILEWEGMSFHSHTDKTRIFYALQHAHVSYICYLEDKIKNLQKVHLGELKYEELEAESYREEDINSLIDTFQILKNEKEALNKGNNERSNIKIKNRPWFLQ